MLKRTRLIAWLTAGCFLAVGTSTLAVGVQCPDLSGDYMIQGEDGQVHISITQYKCDRIVIVRKNGYLGTQTLEKHTLELDAKEHADTRWLGARRRPRTSARFVGSE